MRLIILTLVIGLATSSYASNQDNDMVTYDGKEFIEISQEEAEDLIGEFVFQSNSNSKSFKQGMREVKDLIFWNKDAIMKPDSEESGRAALQYILDETAEVIVHVVEGAGGLIVYVVEGTGRIIVYVVKIPKKMWEWVKKQNNKVVAFNQRWDEAIKTRPQGTVMKEWTARWGKRKMDKIKKFFLQEPKDSTNKQFFGPDQDAR